MRIGVFFDWIEFWAGKTKRPRRGNQTRAFIFGLFKFFLSLFLQLDEKVESWTFRSTSKKQLSDIWDLRGASIERNLSLENREVSHLSGFQLLGNCNEFQSCNVGDWRIAMWLVESAFLPSSRVQTLRNEWISCRWGYRAQMMQSQTF